MDPAEWGVGAMAASFDEEVPMMAGEGTRRLALLDMDWERLRAVDILMVLRSFLAQARPPLPATLAGYGIQRRSHNVHEHLP